MRPRTITVDISRGADYALWQFEMGHTPEDPNDIRHLIHALQDGSRAMAAFVERCRRMGVELERRD